MNYLAHPLTLQLQPCPAKGYYLRWLTFLGTWEGWLFTGAADRKSEVAEATAITTADTRYSVAVRRAGLRTLTVRSDNLTAGQYDALVGSLLTSPQVYRQFPDGTRQPVLVAANASTTRSTDATRFSLELDLTLPAYNALTH